MQDLQEDLKLAFRDALQGDHEDKRSCVKKVSRPCTSAVQKSTLGAWLAQLRANSSEEGYPSCSLLHRS